MTRFTLVATALILGSALPQPAAADPRFWTHDRAVTSGDRPKTHPDVYLMTSAGTSAASAVFVTWQEAGPAGNSDVRLQASFDGGCTWCGPIAWASSDRPETRPRVAAGILPGSPRVSIQVVYEREGKVMVASDASLAVGSAGDMCKAFALLAPPAPRALSALASVGDSRPRLVVVSRTGATGYLQFHAVWNAIDPSGAGGTHVQYDHDLAGDGSGWGPGFADVSTVLGAPGTNPDVAADTVSGSASTSAVTVMYQDTIGTIQMTRSVDAGLTWSKPAAVSGTAKQSLPSADSSAGAGFTSAAWNGCAWQAANDPHDVTFDAAYWTAPSTRNPDFDPSAGDEAASKPASTPGAEPSLSIAPMGQSPAGFYAPAFVFWTRDLAPREIASRAGVLDPNNLGRPRDLDRFPFAGPRVAPPDPTAAVVEPHSNCAWDDGWPALTASSCAVQTRTLGAGAIEVSSADATAFGALPAQFVTVFSDDRTGVSQVYLKSTDGTVEAPLFRSLTAGCEGLLEARADFTFPLLAECPARVESIDRYLVYYGSETSEGASPTGPFVNRAAFARIGLANPAAVSLRGLKPGEVYDFTLIAEDEARNINPGAFDPRAANSSAGASQRRDGVTMPACRPALALECAVSGAACGTSSHPLPANPGDAVTLTLAFTNGGDWDATGVTASLIATGATVVSPAGGLVSIPSIAKGATVPVTVVVQLDASCAADPTLDVQGLTSDGGLVSYGSLACAPPIVAVDCRTECTASCLTGNLSPIRPLKAVKAGTGNPRPDVTFAWPADPASPPQYHVNYVTAKVSIPAAKRPLPGIGQPACGAPAPGCTHAGGVIDPNRLLCYQAFSACGDTGNEEGPE